MRGRGRMCRRRWRRWWGGWRRSRSRLGNCVGSSRRRGSGRGEMAELRYGVDVNTLEKKPIQQLGLNEVAQVSLSLNQPLCFDPYKTNPATGAFIIIDRLTNNTVGAGMILDRGDTRDSADH